jgi:uncharacterized protein (TIRG00374 family)
VKHVLGSVVVAVLAYLAFSLWGGWREVAAAMVRTGAAGFVVLLGLSLLNYLLRFCRWQIYLRQLGVQVAWARSLLIYFSGFALTTTPGKAGEAVRSVFLRRHGASYATGIAAFVSERLSDLIAIVALACLGLGQHPRLQPLVACGVAACVALLLVLSARRSLERWHRATAPWTSRVGRAARQLLGIARAASACQSLPIVLSATALSIVAWACEAWAFHLLLGWLGMPVSWHFAFFVYAVGMLAGALSFLPGGIGGTEAVMIGLLLWGGHAQPDAVAATVVIRFTTLWFAVALGAAALALMARLDRRLDASRPAADRAATGGAA